MPVTLGTLSLSPRDPTRTALERLAAHGNALEARTGAIQASLASVGVPLTLAQIQDALAATGSHPLNATALIGTNPNPGVTVLVGLHTDRLNRNITSDHDHTLWIETDRLALYQVLSHGWQLVASWFLQGQSGDRPGDLGASDVGFYFSHTDNGLIEQWSGNIWHLHSGLMRGAFSTRPAAFVGCDAGLLFQATDRGDHTWYLDFGPGQWVLMEGVGGPMRGTLPIPGLGLTANDVGFLYASTDFDRMYRWTGAGWQDAPGQPSRGMVIWRNDTAPGTGWALCNGAGATSSTATGGTGGITTPNLIGQFLRSNNAAGGTGGALTASVTTGNDTQPPQAVQSGAGTNVPAEPHTHPVLNIPTVPPYTDLVPFIRL